MRDRSTENYSMWRAGFSAGFAGLPAVRLPKPLRKYYQRGGGSRTEHAIYLYGYRAGKTDSLPKG